jgi:hypothetical protein
MRSYRSALFSRIVPTMKDIGLWGPKIRKAYEAMGILGFAEVDVQAISEEDERAALAIEARAKAASAAGPVRARAGSGRS